MQQRLHDLPEERATVLHYTGYRDDHSGIVSVVRALAVAQQFDCIFGVSPGFQPHRPAPLPAVEFSPIDPEIINSRTMWRARRIAREVRRWLAEDDNRVFHGHSRAGLLVALWLGAFRERRVVATVHSYGRNRWFYRWAARRLTGRIFWLTPAMKVYYGVGFPNWDDCMPNSLPVEPVQRHGRRRQPGRLVVGAAGMLVEWKRWHLLLDALAILPPEQRSRIEFRHMGASNGTAESERYARLLVERTQRLGFCSQVHWLGWQPSTERLLAEVDCALVSSRLEPFSMVALEALFNGVPVIAANEGGPRDFILEGQSGWFFRSGDARDLSRVLALLLEPGEYEKARIAPESLTRFRTSTVAEKWRSIYAHVLLRPGT